MTSNKEYRPSIKEITDEICMNFNEQYKRFKEKSPQKIKVAGRFCNYFFKTTGLISTIPYTIFSHYRYLQNFGDEKEMQKEESLGVQKGIMFGILGITLQVPLYTVTILNGHKEILFLPFTTNAISGAYELYRSAKQKVIKKKSIENIL